MEIAPETCYSDEGLCRFITFERVQQILEETVRTYSSSASPRAAKDLRSHMEWTERFEYNTFTDESTGQLTHQSYTTREIEGLIQNECHKLHRAVRSSPHSPEPLDEIFSANLEVKLCLSPSDYQPILSQTWSLLKRMPAMPSPLPDEVDVLKAMPSDYLTENGSSAQKALRVISFVPSSLVRIILYAALHMNGKAFESTGGSGDRERYRILDATAAFIACCARESSSLDSSDPDRLSWFAVRAYLWSFWQRLKFLHLYAFYAGFQHVDLDVDPSYLTQRNFLVAPDCSVARWTQTLAETGRESNLCTWILNLVRSEPYCFGLDFRLLHQRYGRVLGEEPARCVQDSPKPCDGVHSNNCLRFFGANIPNQSAHDACCPFIDGRTSEPRLPWDKTSFLRVQGARAVVISDPDTVTHIGYRQATTQTMAISHVWSHGQGGRPEEGINRCLHQRYCHIASLLGCDSYWMDTTCIPTDHELRREGIMQINNVFSQSRVVLVCDKDLMKIDIDSLSTSTQESILAATLLSDWNTRAWTLLEGMKGRQNIFLLCKNRKTVNLRELMRHVLGSGKIDIAVFIWHIYHMLPIAPPPSGMSEYYLEIHAGQRKVSSQIGSLLSYRPASRPGDDLVVWSLLGAPWDKPYSAAKPFWKAGIGKFLETGYLMSSAKRLRLRGLNWAPESPYATTRDHTRAPPSFYRPTSALQTELGVIEKYGFIAEWFAFEIDSSILNYSKKNSNDNLTAQEREVIKIRSKFIPRHQSGVLLRPIFNHMAFSSEMTRTFDAAISQDGTLCAVCSSNKITSRIFKTYCMRESPRWIWRGVHEWPNEIPLPKFERRGVWLG